MKEWFHSIIHDLSIQVQKQIAIFKKIGIAFLSTVIWGALISLFGVWIMYLFLPEGVFEKKCMTVCGGGGGSFGGGGSTGYWLGVWDFGEFARRWDGSCSGWTKELAKKNVIGNLKHWWAYTTIAVMLWRDHPVIQNNWVSKLTVALSGAFVFGCGFTHLVDVYTVFNPLYNIQTWILNLNGNISIIAMFFVIYGLLWSSYVTKEREQRLQEIRKEVKNV